jgi:hypothetical protein
MLNEIDTADSADEYRFTGTETSPKEMFAFAIERAGILVDGRGRTADGRMSLQ